MVKYFLPNIYSHFYFYFIFIVIQYVDVKYVFHHVLQLALRVPKWNVFIYSINSIDIQYVDIKYVLHHVLQLALRVPKCKMKRFYISF